MLHRKDFALPTAEASTDVMLIHFMVLISLSRLINNVIDFIYLRRAFGKSAVRRFVLSLRDVFLMPRMSPLGRLNA